MNKMWMGIPGIKTQWVPCPSVDSTISRKRYVERIQFENGGGDARRSPAYQMEYNFNVSGPAHELEGIDAFNKFSSGFYGDGLIYVAHPTTFETNVFSAAWGSPGLVKEGWPNIYTNEPTFILTDANEYNYPRYSGVFNITTSPLTSSRRFTIIIPPTHYLAFAATGSTTGAGGVAVDLRDSDGNLIDRDFYDTLNTVDADKTYTLYDCSYVRVYLTRSDFVPSTVTLTSLIGKLIPKNKPTDNIDQMHYMGEGSTGMMFADDAIVETYSYMYPPRKGISTTLVEVEAWR
jgi:hypothetical protein